MHDIIFEIEMIFEMFTNSSLYNGEGQRLRSS